MPGINKEERIRRSGLAEKGMKFCPKCKQDKDIDDFHRSKARADGRSQYCKNCFNMYGAANRKKEHVRARNAEYYRSERGKGVHKKYTTSKKGVDRRRRYDKERGVDGEKRDAYSAVYRAVSSGVIPAVSTLTCAYCGKAAEHYHHWSYLPEHRLDVIPVCAECHKKIHS